FGLPTKLQHIHLQSVRPELLDVAWVVMVPAREATVGSPLRRQVFKIVQIELANYRGSFNTLIFGENKPSSVSVTKARLGDASYLQANQRFEILLLSSPAWAVVHENLHRLIELLNLQWLLQNRDRTDLKNPIEDLAIWVTCDHDNVEVRINLLGCF